jgi:hypothetical protein
MMVTMMGQPSKHTRHKQVVHIDTRTSTNISSIATANPTATAAVFCLVPQPRHRMQPRRHHGRHRTPSHAQRTCTSWLAGWLAGWVAPMSVYDGPLYHLQIRPGQTMTRRDRACQARPGQAKDRTSQLFGEESGRGGGSCVSRTLQVASQTGVCLPYLGSCLEGLVLMWGRRGGKRVCKHLYGSQVRVSRTMEGHAWIELDREAGRQGGRQAGRQAGMRPNICRLRRRSKTLQQVFMQRSCTGRGDCRTKIVLVAMLEKD